MLIHSLRLTRETPAVTVQFHNIHSMKQGNNAKLIFTGSKSYTLQVQRKNNIQVIPSTMIFTSLLAFTATKSGP